MSLKDKEERIIEDLEIAEHAAEHYLTLEEKKELPLIEKFLTLWIFLAIIFGVALGYAYPEIANLKDRSA